MLVCVTIHSVLQSSLGFAKRNISKFLSLCLIFCEKKMESLTEENEDTRKIVVEFQHAESINRFRLVGSNISLRTTECDHCFKWVVD